MFYISYIKLWEVYKISMNSTMAIGNQGFWSEKIGISMENEEKRYSRLRDLKGLHLKMASQP